MARAMSGFDRQAGRMESTGQSRGLLCGAAVARWQQASPPVRAAWREARPVSRRADGTSSIAGARPVQPAQRGGTVPYTAAECGKVRPPQR
jgi:hypothetical protein